MPNRSASKARQSEPAQEIIIEGELAPAPSPELDKQAAPQEVAEAAPAQQAPPPGQALPPGLSPLIMQLSWGKMVVEGLGAGRDFKLYPGGGRPWDWSETDTHHMPGIQIADVEELVAHGCKVVVLSRGMDMVLHVKADTLAYLRERGVEVHVEETRAAADRYNQLALAEVPVGGLFHSTC